MHPLRPRAWVLERPRHLKAEEAHILSSDPRLRALLVSGRLWTGVHQQIPQHHTAEWWDTHTPRRYQATYLQETFHICQ